MIQKVWKSFLAIAKYLLIFFITVGSIVGSSFFSLYLSKLATGRTYPTDVGIRGAYQYQYPDLAFAVGLLGYIVVLPTALFLIKRVFNPENRFPYWIGIILGIPYLFFHILVLSLHYG